MMILKLMNLKFVKLLHFKYFQKKKNIFTKIFKMFMKNYQKSKLYVLRYKTDF